MPETSDKKIVQASPTTELRIIIKEDAMGKVSVRHEATRIDTNELIEMRPTHIVGQMMVAAFFVVIKLFDSFRREVIEKSKEG